MSLIDNDAEIVERHRVRDGGVTPSILQQHHQLFLVVSRHIPVFENDFLLRQVAASISLC